MFSQQLENSLNEFGEKWVLNPGDGAFYGPKVSRGTLRPAGSRRAAHRSFHPADRHPDQGRHRPLPPVCHHSAGLPAANPLQPHLCWVSALLGFIVFLTPPKTHSHLKSPPPSTHTSGRNDGDDKNRPVIIHRAILGSVERMIAILTENFGGKWWVVGNLASRWPPSPSQKPDVSLQAPLALPDPSHDRTGGTHLRGVRSEGNEDFGSFI